MKILIICRQTFPHSYQKEMIDSFMKTAFHADDEIVSVFFTGDAAGYCLKQSEDSGKREFRQMLKDNREEVREYLVCARAIRSMGADESCLDPDFKISGNMELSQMIAEADRVVEF
ncbi:MAG: DsrE family protein [Succinivibrio sp.]